MPSLFERLGRTLVRKKTDELISKPLEKPPSTANESNGKPEPVASPDARAAPTEFPSIQDKARLRQKRFSRAKSPSARPVPTPRVPVLSLRLPELKDAAVAKAHRLTFEAIVEDPELTPEAIAKRRLTPPETAYLAKQTSRALHGKGMYEHNPRRRRHRRCAMSCCPLLITHCPLPIANVLARCRTRHTRHLQTTLALRLPRRTIQTHYAFPSIYCKFHNAPSASRRVP